MVMTMTAMQSLKDPKMLYLDISAGVFGLILFNLVTHGQSKFDIKKYPLHLAAMVLVARVIVDFMYNTFVSKTDQYGGSNLEFFASSAMWFMIMYFMNKQMDHGLSMKNIAVLYAMTLLAMFAIARLTHWG